MARGNHTSHQLHRAILVVQAGGIPYPGLPPHTPYLDTPVVVSPQDSNRSLFSHIHIITYQFRLLPVYSH